MTQRMSGSNPIKLDIHRTREGWIGVYPKLGILAGGATLDELVSNIGVLMGKSSGPTPPHSVGQGFSRLPDSVMTGEVDDSPSIYSVVSLEMGGVATRD